MQLKMVAKQTMVNPDVPIQALVPLEWDRHRLQRFARVLPCMLYEYVMAPNGRRELLFVGSNCQELLELEEKDFLADATLFAALVLEEDLQRLIAEDVAANLEGVAFTSEVRIQTSSGRRKWVQLSSRPNPPTDSGIVVWSGFMLDFTERKLVEEQVRQLALFDPLTNLPNRRLLNDRLLQAMSASDRSGAQGALMVLDLDNFKIINDKYGHLAGDELLIEAAARLKRSVRAMDTVGRFGGDEFVVMLSELSLDAADSMQQASAVAEKIRSALAEPFLLQVTETGQALGTVQHRCGASIGAILFSGLAVDQDSLIKGADAAMYRAKAAGRNQVRFCAASNGSG